MAILVVHYFFISLLVFFELAVGILVLSGGKRTQSSGASSASASAT